MKWKPYTVLILLSIIIGIQVLYYLFFVESVSNGQTVTTRILSEDVVYSGYILLVIIIMAVLMEEVVWKLTLGLLLTCAAFGFIDFTERTFIFGIGDVKLRLLPIGFLILHGMLNIDKFHSLRSKLNVYEEIDFIPYNESPQLEKVAFFEKKFRSKSSQELQEIIALNELVSEAIIASKNILENRK